MPFFPERESCSIRPRCNKARRTVRCASSRSRTHSSRTPAGSRSRWHVEESLAAAERQFVIGVEAEGVAWEAAVVRIDRAEALVSGSIVGQRGGQQFRLPKELLPPSEVVSVFWNV